MTWASSSHSPSCAASRSCIRLAPTEKLSRSPEMTKPAKSRTASEAGLRTEEMRREHVAADGVLERVQLDAADAVAEIDERSAGVGANDPVRAAEIGHAGVARDGGNGNGSGPSTGWKHASCAGRVPACARGGEQSLRRERRREAERLHAGDGLGHAGRIPHFKGAQLPVEAGAHGGVDGGRVVGNFADAVGGEVPERSEKRPQKCRGFVFGGVVGEQQCAGARAAWRRFSPFRARAARVWRQGDIRRWQRSRTRRSSLPIRSPWPRIFL